MRIINSNPNSADRTHVLIFNSDLGGCMTYRNTIPFNELKRFGVTYMSTPELPNNPWGSDFVEMCRFVEQFDFVIVQRCYKYPVVKYIRDVCDLLGIKMIFETDDDYFNLPPRNPCYGELAPLEVRQGYAEILKMSDAITVSTQELGDVIWAFNRNIHVLPNNVESILCGEVGPPCRGHAREEVGEDGRLKFDLNNTHGFVTCPDYWIPPNKGPEKVIRIGYTGTPSHYEDFETIHYGLERVLKKFEKRIWLIYIGDRYFYDVTENGKGRKIHIPVSQYHLYQYHIRNLDIGIAPLARNVFNMSKSSIKAVEYGMWGIPAVLPNYITYNRDFTDGKNCLMYNNRGEFEDQLVELIENHQLRETLGEGARDYVRDNRLEKLHAERRFNIYKSIVTETPKPIRYEPQGVVA